MKKHLIALFYIAPLALYSFFTLPLLLPKFPEQKKLSQYDAIIVLGAGLEKHCVLGDALKARMDKAIGLYQQKKGGLLILSGGAVDENCVEAQAMYEYALSKNIPSEHLIRESNSQNTYQNAYYSIEALKHKNMRSAIVVTSDFHCRRANLIFSKYNMQYAIESSENGIFGAELTQNLFREQMMLCFHTIFGVPANFGLNIKDKKAATIFKAWVLR